MDLDGWLVEYRKICRELGILAKDDYEARDVAGSVIGDRKQPLEKLEALIRNREVIVFGAGPSLEKDIKKIDKKGKTLIAADGTTSCLLENGLYPDIVVTDLDGEIKDLLLADRFGAVMVTHAHGGNTNKIKSILPKIKNPVVTTQTEPLPNVHNFFGFTDGDRAVFLAKHFKAKGIELVGFDFGDMVGKYSKPEKPEDHKADERKKKKLEIAEELVKLALSNP